MIAVLTTAQLNEFVDKAEMEECEDEVAKKAEEILTPLLTKDGKGPTYH